jgi:hypothetical protein
MVEFAELRGFKDLGFAVLHLALKFSGEYRGRGRNGGAKPLTVIVLVLVLELVLVMALLMV